MSRNLLILVMLTVSGSGCSASRPFLGHIVVTPPKVSFRQLSREESSPWTSVSVTYPAETWTPAPCAPSPICPVEEVAYFEDKELPAPQTICEPVPSTSITSIPPAPLPTPAIVNLDCATSQKPIDLTAPRLGCGPVEMVMPIIQAAAVSMPPDTGVQLESLPQATVTQPCDQAVVASLEVLPDAAQAQALAPLQADLSELLSEIRQQRQLIEALQRDLARERSADNSEIQELEAAVEDLVALTQSSRPGNPAAAQK